MYSHADEVRTGGDQADAALFDLVLEREHGAADKTRALIGSGLPADRLVCSVAFSAVDAAYATRVQRATARIDLGAVPRSFDEIASALATAPPLTAAELAQVWAPWVGAGCEFGWVLDAYEPPVRVRRVAKRRKVDDAAQVKSSKGAAVVRPSALGDEGGDDAAQQKVTVAVWRRILAACAKSVAAGGPARCPLVVALDLEAARRGAAEAFEAVVQALFAVSFLLKEGRLGVAEPLPDTPGVSLYQATPSAANAAVERKQAIFSLTSDLAAEMVAIAREFAAAAPPAATSP